MNASRWLAIDQRRYNISVNSVTQLRSIRSKVLTFHIIFRYIIGSPKIGVESFVLMIEHILVSILFNLTRATLLSLRNHIKVAPYSLVQFINYLYRSATSDVILTTFAWNFRGSGNILKQAAESCF